MTIKLTYNEYPQTYYCTFTCINWLNRFHSTDLYDKIYAWFNILIQEQHQITGFVIMPNHLHALIHIRHDKSNINKILGNAKRFLAYDIVNRLKTKNRQDLLHIMSEKVTSEEKSRNKKHRAFEISSDIKMCWGEEFLLQKLEYIHANPVSGKWKLADSYVEYPHSSAAFYELNVPHPKVAITHYKDLGGAVNLPTKSFLSGDDTRTSR
ncbi:MAG: transposase [Cyclobacteriaceae bacterium]